MITISPVKDKAEIEKYYLQFNQPFTENCGITLAQTDNKFLGCCLYEIDDKKIVINLITPQDDIMLVDGILRSALHIADFRGITDAFYSQTAPETLFKKLSFIKNEQEKSLKIEKLHESGCCCQKNFK